MNMHVLPCTIPPNQQPAKVTLNQKSVKKYNQIKQNESKPNQTKL